MIPSEPVPIEDVESNPWDSIFETEPNLCEMIRLEQNLAQIDLEVISAFDGSTRIEERLEPFISGFCSD